MYCEFCGKPVSDYAKYCRSCGATLDYYRSEQQTTPMQEQPEKIEEAQEA